MAVLTYTGSSTGWTTENGDKAAHKLAGIAGSIPSTH